MPILVSSIGGLSFAVIIAGGGGETRVVITNADARPIACRATVVDDVQVIATRERRLADARHAIGDYDARQATAKFERISVNVSHATRDRDALKATTTIECTSADARNTIGNCNAHKATTTKECTGTDERNAFRNCDTLKATTTIERRHNNACSASYHYRFQSVWNILRVTGITNCTENIPKMCKHNSSQGFSHKW